MPAAHNSYSTMSPRHRYRSTPSDHPYGRGPRRSLDTLQLPDPQSDGLSRGPPDARSSPVPVHKLLTALSPPPRDRRLERVVLVDAVDADDASDVTTDLPHPTPRVKLAKD